MAKVVDYLLDQGWITRAQVDEAFRTQGFFGGQIESHLLRLGYVGEAVLGTALTETSGVPYASWEHLRSVPQAALDAFPARLVERYRVFPILLEDDRLRLAMRNPRDQAAIRDIQTTTGYVVEPWIAVEPRLYQAIERHYRIRFEGPKGITPAGLPGPRATPRRSSLDPGGDSSDSGSAPEVGLDGRPLDAEPNFEEYLQRSGAWSAEREPAQPAPPSESAGPAISPADVNAFAQGTSLDALDEALASARDRDEVAEALFAFCADRSARAGLFGVGKDGIRGIAGRGRGFDTERLRKVSVPLRSGTIFDTALQSRDFYFGVVPALPANRDLYTALGGKIPANVMILPIVVKERTAALFYLDAEADPLPHPNIPMMLRVAAKAGFAFELLLLRSKIREI